MTERYRAPFLPGGSHAIDDAFAGRLLSEALAHGGDYADLFFEYSASGSVVLEDGVIKNASRGVSLGLGVRVQSGDATGYAYTEALDEASMLDAARTAARVASGGGAAVPPISATPRTSSRYHGAATLELSGDVKVGLLRRADAAARAYDPRITKVNASFVEALREVSIFTSDGEAVRDRQPMIRFNVSAIAETDGKRQSGSSGGGGRVGLEYFMQAGRRPEDHGREAARIALDMLDAREAPAGELPGVLAAGRSSKGPS